MQRTLVGLENFTIGIVILKPVLRIRIYYYADPDKNVHTDPDASPDGSKRVNTKEEKLHQKMFN